MGKFDDEGYGDRDTVTSDFKNVKMSQNPILVADIYERVLSSFPRSQYWTPDASRSGSYKITLVYLFFISLFIISDPFFSETALTIFIKLRTMLDIDQKCD